MEYFLKFRSIFLPVLFTTLVNAVIPSYSIGGDLFITPLGIAEISASPIVSSLKKREINPKFLEQILIRSGYSDTVIPDIIKKLKELFAEIDITRIQEDLKSGDIEKLKISFNKLFLLLDKKGYYNIYRPKLLMSLLVSSVDEENIFTVIKNAKIKKGIKKNLTGNISSCGAVSQLAYILLSSLGVEVKGANAVEHVFTLFFLTKNKALFVDFSLKIVQEVDLSKYYQKEGAYLVLKQEHRIEPIELLKLKKIGGFVRHSLLSKKTLLNLRYFYIHISDGYALTSSIHVVRGDTYAILGNRNKAIIEYEKAITLDPNLADAHSNLGFTYVAIDKYDLAIKEFQKAMKLNPNCPEIYCNLGLAYNELGQYEEAIEKFLKAIKYSRYYTKAYYNLAVAYYKLGEYDETIRVLRNAIIINYPYPKARTLTGKAYYMLGKYQEALNELTKSIEFDSDSADAHYALGLSYNKLSKYNEALREFKKVIKLNPTANAYCDLAFAYYQLGKYRRAINNWTKGVNRNPKLLSLVPTLYQPVVKRRTKLDRTPSYSL